jgi:hypothetical protein
MKITVDIMTVVLVSAGAFFLWPERRVVAFSDTLHVSTR